MEAIHVFCGQDVVRKSQGALCIQKVTLNKSTVIDQIKDQWDLTKMPINPNLMCLVISVQCMCVLIDASRLSGAVLCSRALLMWHEWGRVRQCNL